MVNNSEEVIQCAFSAWSLLRDCSIKLEIRGTDALPPVLVERLLEIHPDNDAIRYKLALDQLQAFYYEHFGKAGAEAVMKLVTAEESYRMLGEVLMKHFGAPLELEQAGRDLDDAQQTVDDLLGGIRVTQRRVTRQASSLQTVSHFLAKRKEAHAELFIFSEGGVYPPKWASQSH